MFVHSIAALFTIAKKWKQPKYSQMDEWVNKIWFINTVDSYLATKETEVLIPVTMWMNLENMLSERKDHTSYDYIYMKC